MTKGWKSVKNANKHCDLIICPIAATSLNKQLESRCCSSHMMTNREPYSLEALCLVLQFDMFGKSQRKQLHMSWISAASELSRVKYAFQVVNDVRIECLQQPDLQGNMDCSQQWDNTLLAQWMHWFFSCSATEKVTATNWSLKSGKSSIPNLYVTTFNLKAIAQVAWWETTCLQTTVFCLSLTAITLRLVKVCK